MRRIIIVEDDDGNEIRMIGRPGRRGFEGWICPYCGKRVYSMEVHQCFQPWCEQTRDDGWLPGGTAWDECHPEDGPFCWNYGGDK